MEHFETAFVMPELMSNDSFEQWVVDGELDAEARAVEKVKELLDRYEEPALPDDVDEELRDYVARRRTELPEMIV